jgi:GT2 family glycosyltransferase
MSDQSAPGGTPPAAALVTVIIRTKDRPGLLERALESVVAQDYRPLEALVVNDGQQDLAALHQRFAPSLQGLRVVAAAAPGGRIRAANTGLDQALGKFLIFLDDDDWFYADHVSKLVTSLQQHPEQALAYTGVECRRADPDTGELRTEHVFNQPFEHGFLLVRNFIPMHAAMFRSSLLDAATRFDETLDYYEDWDFWLQLSRKTGFRYVPGISACYFLGSSGFGVEQTQRQLAAEQRFFAKWQHLWTPRELELIVEYARELPGVRQSSHDYLVTLNTRLDEEIARHSSLSAEYASLLSKHQEELGRYDALQQAHEALQVSIQNLQQAWNDEHARHEQLAQTHGQLQSAHQKTTEQLQQLQDSFTSMGTEHALLKDQYQLVSRHLQQVLASRSWRLTAPLRWAMTVLRECRQALRRFGQRVRNAVRILREQGVLALMAHVQRKLRQRSPAPAPALVAVQVSARSEQSAVITPIPLRVIAPKDQQAVAQKLAFPGFAAPRVSVIIPVYNHSSLTLACLQALHDNLPHCSFEVIVVDDASSDDTQTLLAQCQGLHYLRNDNNSGFIQSCNRGAELARGDYLFFLNNDSEVQAGWLDPLVATLDTNERAGIAGSKLVYPSGYLQEAGACLRADGTVELVGLNGDPADPRYNYARAVDHCSGAAILVRAPLFRELGGFDRRYLPAYFEDCDLSLKVQEAGYRVIYQPASVVVHHLSVSTGSLPGGKLAQIARNRGIYLERWGKYLQEQDRIRLIAFFLPQFHPIPENDAWWGKGFTEWTNVTRAKPLFDDHYQPHRPAELGYYDLRVAEVREQQTALAREHGVYGFCYYYYWFDGKRLLERPLNDMLERGEPDFPFCVCWANENWTRRWDGREAEVLMAQDYNPESNQQFMRDLLPLLRDPRYIRINGRPLVLIYRAELIPGLSEAIAGWRQLTRAEGLGEVYLAAVESFSGVHDDLACDFDALVEFPPHARSVAVAQLTAGLRDDFSGQMYDYEASSRAFMQRPNVPPQLFRTAMPSWDNTPRRQQAAHIYLGATPPLYQNWLASLVRETRERRMGDERIVFVNAWNEWAEGNHLEPDERYGRDWLEATRAALGDLAPCDSQSDHDSATR